MIHDDPIGGHNGTDRMFGKMRTRYFWPQIYENIRHYIKNCDACQRKGGPTKNNTLHPKIFQN